MPGAESRGAGTSSALAVVVAIDERLRIDHPGPRRYVDALVESAIDRCRATASIGEIIVHTAADPLDRDEAVRDAVRRHLASTMSDDGVETVVVIDAFAPFLTPTSIDALVARLESSDSASIATGAAAATRIDRFVEGAPILDGRVEALVVDPSEALLVHEPDTLDRLRASIDRLASGRRGGEPSQERLARVRAVVFDFDGVMTDDTVIVHADGTESIVAHRGDGMGVGLLRAAGLPMLILSKEQNPIVRVRADKLGVEVIHGCDDKATALDRWCAENGIDIDAIAYVGNDINDLECLERVGLAVCPSDADGRVISVADWVLSRPGGRGAVRELADALIRTRIQSAD